MERLRNTFLALITLFAMALPAHATVYLNQTNWTTAARTRQFLPTNSAWFASSSGSLSVSSSALRLIVTTSSGMEITYFTPASNSPPVTLNVGDTLTATIKFTFNGVPPAGSSSQGFRLGLFDFADASNSPVRVTADGGFSSSSQGNFAEGYALFGKMYGTLADDQPIDIRKRVFLADSSLLGASGDWTSIGKTSVNTNTFDGFTNQTAYTLQFVFQRTNLTSLAITETWSNLTNNATLSVSTVDNTATNFSYDGIAFRPANNTQAAATNLFQLVSVTTTSAPVAPSIITQPQDLSVSSGQSPAFSVVPNGTLPLFYQWYFNTNTPLSSGTVNFAPAHTLAPNPSVTITNAQDTDEGTYLVIISNAYGSVTSSVANLTVTLSAPIITSQPQDLTVIPGQYATFSVAAVGSEPFTYQWYHNTNTLVTGATEATLILTNVQPVDAGIYSVIVSNPIGSVSSSNAVLTVNTNPSAPVFILQPASLTARVGDNINFSAAAVGDTPISYQWMTNNVPISGATSPTFNLPSVHLTDAGTYVVVASNSIGTTTSSNAVLTVIPRTPPLPVIPTNQFNILDFGGWGDGVSNNATAINNTINAAAAAGGGIVVVPTNGSLNMYLSGPIALSNSIDLQVNSGATLKMLPRFATPTITNWPGPGFPFISGSALHDIAITGAGTIDGNAGFGSTNWWQSPTLDESQRPHLIDIGGTSTRILIQGVTLQNPPVFHMFLKGNNVSVTVQNITESTPGNSPNTDGMDLASTNVLIQNCSISVGDDNLEIGGSAGPAADIVVSNCTFGAGHGVSIGSDMEGGVHDLTVSNCTFNGTDQGIRMKSDRDIGGVAENLKYLDLTMTNVGYVVLLFDFYDTIGTPNNISPTTAANNAAQPVIDTTPIWRNITISNVTASGLTGSGVAGILWARQEMPVSNFTLCAVNIAAPTKTFGIYSARGIKIIDSNLTAPSTTNTLNLYNAEVTITNTTASTNLVTLGGLTRPGTNNTMSFINSLATIREAGVLGSNPLTIASSTLTINPSSVDSSNNPITVVAASTLTFTGGNNSLNGALNGSSALTLNLPGSSVLTLRGDSSGFGGALVVSNSGTLLVNNATGSGTGTGAVSVLSGAKLGGGGVLGGPLTVNGTLAPGNSPGTLAVSNDVAVSGGAVLQYELGTASDLTVVSGNLTLGGTLNVTDAGGFTNATYTLFTYGGTLTYNGLAVGTTPTTNFNYAIDTSTAGLVELVVSVPTPPPVDPFVAWQLAYFGCTNLAVCPQAAGGADPDGDGISNTNEFLAGTNPTNSASALRIISVVRQSNDLMVTWTTAGGRTNSVEATASDANGNYTTNFMDVSGPIAISGSGDATTNYVDGGGATNSPSRYYRIRLVP